MFQLLKSALCISILLVASACGQTKTDRALSGAGIGAGVGAAGSALTGGSAVQGGVIGAGVGAAAGALTDEDDVDLGEPAWKR